MQDEQNVLGGAPKCEDTKETCQDWEALGECVSNYGYMRLVCPKTCRVAGCWDKHVNCQIWADMGQCEENFQYMVETCPVKCRQRRAWLAVERSKEDAKRLQELRDARGEQDDVNALDASLKEEAIVPGEDAEIVEKEREPVVYQPAHAVTGNRRRVPAAAPPVPSAAVTTPAPEEELEIAWVRVLLAGQLLNSGQLFSVLALVRAGDCAVRARCHLRGRRACLSRSKPGGL